MGVGKLVCGCMTKEGREGEVWDECRSLLVPEKKVLFSMGVMREGSVDAEIMASSVEWTGGIDDKLIGFTCSMEVGETNGEGAVPLNETCTVDGVVRVKEMGLDGRGDNVEVVEGKEEDWEKSSGTEE